METRSLTHLTVWLSDESDGPLRHAVDWADCFGVPLRVLAMSDNTSLMDRINALGLVCAKRGIMMEATFQANATDEMIRSYSMCFVEEGTRAASQTRIVERAAQRSDVLLALTPPAGQPMMRFLVVNERVDPDGCFLKTSARLCRALAVEPFVLTLAGSERDALAKQGFAQGILGSMGVRGDFDSVVAEEPRVAIARVAAWRACSHVVCARAVVSSGGRRQRRRDDALGDYRVLARQVTLVAIPENLAVDFPRLDFPGKARASAANRLTAGVVNPVWSESSIP